MRPGNMKELCKIKQLRKNKVEGNPKGAQEGEGNTFKDKGNRGRLRELRKMKESQDVEGNSGR